LAAATVAGWFLLLGSGVGRYQLIAAAATQQADDAGCIDFGPTVRRSNNTTY